MFDIRFPVRRYEQTVANYEDKGLDKGRIVFFGNSGFANWDAKYGIRSMEEDILLRDGSPAVWNHGLGGSTTEDQLYYYHRLVRQYEPRALVLLSFGNNLENGYTPGEMMTLLARICGWARADMPGIRIFLCDVRPWAAYQDNTAWRGQVHVYNRLLDEYAAKYEDTVVLKHRESPLFFEEGFVGDYSHPRQDIFVEDNIHYNQKGFDLYGEFFREGLKDLL